MKKESKASLKRKCKAILNSGVSVVKGSDYDFLISVFKKHPYWNDKRGTGVKYITIERGDSIYNVFMINRTDGTKIDISYNVAISPPNKLTQIKKAARNSIGYIIDDFKDKNFKPYKMTCEFTGELLCPGNTHVDHYDKTFIELFNEWMKDKDVNDVYNSIVEEQISNFKYNNTVLSGEIRKSFEIYHNNNTHLRLISKTANLTIVKKLKKTKTL